MSAPPPGSLQIGLVVAISLAFVGFFAGVSDEVSDAAPTRIAAAAEPASESAPPARSWREMRTWPRGTGSGLETDLAALRAAGPSRLDPVNLSGAVKGPALADRAERRAYDGAPPTIPHPIRQDSAPECLVCHGEGLQFRGVVAPSLPHRELTSCTSCHVVEAAPMPAEAWLARTEGENAFAGRPAPLAGERAWSIAPPTIPHSTAMRESCLSCHGPLGRQALRSTHPQRETCTQCHAVSATLELRPGVGTGPGGAAP